MLRCECVIICVKSAPRNISEINKIGIDQWIDRKLERILVFTSDQTE
jgi:hypothetical protein